MPYIPKEKRDQLDPVVWEMRERDIKADGDLNYVLYAFCARYVPESYNSLKNYCAELRACATEIERTMLGPYEDSREELHGKIE